MAHIGYEGIPPIMEHEMEKKRRIKWKLWSSRAYAGKQEVP